MQGLLQLSQNGVLSVDRKSKFEMALENKNLSPEEARFRVHWVLVEAFNRARLNPCANAQAKYEYDADLATDVAYKLKGVSI